MAINSLSASSYGLSGLVSGMDTQSMVEKMLSGTQAKIDKKIQQKTVLQYKQSMYRDVMSQLKTFQNKFMSFTGTTTNLYSSSFYNSMTASVNAPTGTYANFSVTASSSAKTGTTNVEYVKQMATAQSYKTGYEASSKVKGTMSQASAQNLLSKYYSASKPGDNETVLTIKVGDNVVRIDNAPLTFAGKSETQVAEYINEQFKNSNVKAVAKYDNNKLVITADSAKDAISIYGNTVNSTSTLPMKMFGDTNYYLSGTGSFSASINTSNYSPSFTVNLDGRSQTITMDLGLLKNYAGATTDTEIEAAKNALVAGISENLTKAFGSGVSAEIDTLTGDITFKTASTSSKFTVTGDANVMGVLGITSGISNKISTSLALKDLNFSQALQGGRYTFSINGVDFSYSEETTLASIINDINNSKAGVTVFYVESQDYFVIANASTGAGYDPIDMKNIEGNFLTALFGVQGGSTVSTSAVYKDITSADNSATGTASAYRSGGVFTFNVDGKDYKFTVKQKGENEYYTAAEFAAKMNQAFGDTFGYLSDGSNAVGFAYDQDTDSFRIATNDTSRIVKTVAQNSSTNMSLLGFAVGDTTRVTNADIATEYAGISFGNATIEILIGDSTVPFTVDTSAYNDTTTFRAVAEDIQAQLQEAYKAYINAQTGLSSADKQALLDKADDASVEFDKTNSSFTIKGMEAYQASISLKRDTANDTSVNLDRLFGAEGITVNSAPVAGGQEELTKAQNAIISIDGIEIERSTNNFEYNGLLFVLTSETSPDKLEQKIVNGKEVTVSSEQPTQIVVTRDTQKILDGIKEFIEEYNKLVTSLYELYQAEPTYKDYAPLTDSQKSEMSDREIELWEEKSKAGLLKNDDNIYRILSAMRQAMYSKPNGSTLAIYDLGITTSYYISDGNFQIPSDSDLLAMIEKDPEGIQQLFAGDGGIMEKLTKAINEAIRSQGGEPGYFTVVAGSNDLDTTSSLYKQIKDMDNRLTSLETRYWNEYDRYWKQFNQMEKLIQQMNTQSGWLSQMLGS